MPFMLLLLFVTILLPISLISAKEKLEIEGAITIENSASEAPARGTI